MKIDGFQLKQMESVLERGRAVWSCAGSCAEPCAEPCAGLVRACAVGFGDPLCSWPAGPLKIKVFPLTRGERLPPRLIRRLRRQAQMHSPHFVSAAVRLSRSHLACFPSPVMRQLVRPRPVGKNKKTVKLHEHIHIYIYLYKLIYIYI